MCSDQNLLRRRHLGEAKANYNMNDKEKSWKINFNEVDSFHRAISPVLQLTQCISIMPVVGIRNSNPYCLKFSVKSVGMIPAIAFLFFGSFFTLFYLKNLFSLGVDAKNFAGIVFYLVGLSVCSLFLFLARNWPDLMQVWFDTEMIFLAPPYEPLKRTLATKIRAAAAVIIISAIIEHMLFLSSAWYNYKEYKITCNISNVVYFSEFLEDNFRHVFQVFPFSLLGGIAALFINFLFTFMWNYMDLFVVMVSLGLSARFQQINNRILSLSGKDVAESTWMEIRHHFVLLCELLETVDETISAIILLSSMNNLYFICLQLLNILNKLRYTITYVYFWASLLYLISRTTCVFLYAASINDEAAKPLKTLRVVPSRAWSTEIERFIEQITTQCVALSGMKFFYLTRKLFFGMAGTIVTYELVLLQFDAPNSILVIFLGNFFGVMPLSGVLAKNANRVAFKWISIQTIFSLLVAFMGVFEVITATYRAYKSSFKLYSLGPATFYLVCEIGMILTFCLATKWSSIIRFWNKTEEIFWKSSYRNYIGRSLKYKIWTTAAMYLIIAIIEHLLFLSAAFLNSQLQIDKCNFTYGVIENMYRREKAHFFDLFYFEMWMLPIVAWHQFSLTMCSTLFNVIIAVSSIAIATNFNLITKRLGVTKHKMMPESFWIDIRRHYRAQCDLLFFLDDQYSGLILLACSSGMYVTCLQLFNISMERPSLMDKIFSWYTLLFLIFRTLVTLFYASSIYDSSRKPLMLLREISTKYWTLEVQRFSNEVSQQTVAFSGKQFFFITRKLIFAMAGTVVTYELVLLDNVKEYSDIKNFCQIFGKV